MRKRWHHLLKFSKATGTGGREGARERELVRTTKKVKTYLVDLRRGKPQKSHKVHSDKVKAKMEEAKGRRAWFNHVM